MTVVKRLTYEVRADTLDEARALALVTANGAGNRNALESGPLRRAGGDRGEGGAGGR